MFICLCKRSLMWCSIIGNGKVTTIDPVQLPINFSYCDYSKNAPASFLLKHIYSINLFISAGVNPLVKFKPIKLVRYIRLFQVQPLKQNRLINRHLSVHFFAIISKKYQLSIECNILCHYVV